MSAKDTQIEKISPIKVKFRRWKNHFGNFLRRKGQR